MLIALNIVSWKSAHGQGSGVQFQLDDPLGGNSSFEGIIQKVSNFLMTLLVPVATIMALWGGFQMLTAGGDEAKFKKGRQTLTYAAIGAIVVLVSGGLVDVITSFLS